MKTQTQKQIQTIILSNRILIKAPVLLAKEVQGAFTITNPAYINSCRFGKSRFKPKKFLPFWILTKEGITIPRGSLDKLKTIYKGIKLNIIDERNKHPDIKWKFKGALKEEKGQLQIKKFKSTFGIIKAPTGSGKTVMFLWLMQKFKQPTIIIVHTNLLLKQWPKRIEQFLGIKEKDVGIIAAGKVNIKPVTVALMQTLVKFPKVLDSFGCLCCDEVHRSPAKTYTKIINSYNGKYLIGLSATPSRRDGQTSVMKWYVGGIKINISLENANLCDCYYKFVITKFVAEECFQRQYSRALVELTRNKERNELIIKTALQNIEVFGIHLILSQNRAHCLKLFKMLPDHIRLISKVLTGKINKEDRKEIISKAQKGELKFIIATDKLIGEGFDEPLLSVVHLTTPIADKNRLIQYVGRIRRQLKGKKYSLVFDYFDVKEGVLRGGVRKRSAAYTENNIKEWRVKNG